MFEYADAAKTICGGGGREGGSTIFNVIILTNLYNDFATIIMIDRFVLISVYISYWKSKQINTNHNILQINDI